MVERLDESLVFDRWHAATLRGAAVRWEEPAEGAILWASLCTRFAPVVWPRLQTESRMTWISAVVAGGAASGAARHRRQHLTWARLKVD
jgi:hypothetical protein